MEKQPAPILVTGASGYLASWIVKLLLERGWVVHATVRNLEQETRLHHLHEMASRHPKQLRLFAADLLDEGSFTEAMSGCEVVIHTASPFKTGRVRDPESELIIPAVSGTRNVLETACRSGMVRRVVLTSSAAAIYADASDLERTKQKIFTESDWNTTAHAGYQAYSYSKTLAERKAWEIADSTKQWDLVVMNPTFILGPSLSLRVDSASIAFMRDMVNGRFRFGMPAMELGIVDVRDVAMAHIAAVEHAAASGRHILMNQVMSMLDIASILEDQIGNQYPLPGRQIPRWLVALMAPVLGISRQYAKRHIGKPMAFDNRYGISDLGISYRPIEETLLDHFQQLRQDGLVRSR